MSYSPVAFIAPNYRDYNTWWFKAYIPSTTTPKILAIDIAGATTVAKLQLNANGFFVSAGGAIVMPYIDGSYDAYLFRTEALADANDTAGAVRVADNILSIESLGVIRATSVANIASYSAPAGSVFSLNSGNRSGIFDVIAGDFSTELTADTFNGIYVGQADDPTAASKVAKRRYLESVSPEWFGAVDNGTNQAEIINHINISGNIINLSGKSFTYTGTFVPVAVFINGSIISDNRTYDFSINTLESKSVITQGRGRIDYGTATSSRVFVPESLIMSGFRFLGSYKKPNGRAVSTAVDGSILVNDTTDLSVLNTRKVENWYALFAGANNIASATSFVNLPFFRVRSVAGNVITLGDGAEDVGEATIPAVTYDMDVDIAAGSEVLIINESGNFSGKTTTVVSNTTTTVTLTNAEGLATGDFFLLSPPEFDQYCYLGSWYLDTAQPRNRADTGSIVGAVMRQVPNLDATGALDNEKASFRAVCSPLATAYITNFVFSLATSGTGAVAHYFSHDSSNHRVASNYIEKLGTSTQTFAQSPILLPFSKEQASYITTAGSLEASVSARTLQCYGWLEP